MVPVARLVLKKTPPGHFDPAPRRSAPRSPSPEQDEAVTARDGADPPDDGEDVKGTRNSHIIDFSGFLFRSNPDSVYRTTDTSKRYGIARERPCAAHCFRF
jgi:hypothetical protein